jgi:hypothetical protein
MTEAATMTNLVHDSMQRALERAASNKPSVSSVKELQKQAVKYITRNDAAKKITRAKVHLELVRATESSIVDLRDVFLDDAVFDEVMNPQMALAHYMASEVRLINDTSTCKFESTFRLRKCFGLKWGQAYTHSISLSCPTTTPKALAYKAKLSRENDMESRIWRMSGSRPPKLYTALVPPMPRSLEPRSAKVRHKTLMLFDVPQWERLEIPFDPFLLEEVSKWHVRILAHWDLTPREREVLQKMQG